MSSYRYVQEILANTSSSVDQVNIEPNATWSPVGANNSRSNGRFNGATNGHDDDSDSDEDLVEITKPKQPVMKVEASNVPFSFSKLTPPNQPSMTPPVPPAASAASSGPRPGQKRKSEVIDLTLSDDDEPPAKKPHYSTPNSLPDYGQQKNGYPSYPRSNHYALNTNGNVSHQVQTHSTHPAITAVREPRVLLTVLSTLPMQHPILHQHVHRPAPTGSPSTLSPRHHIGHHHHG